MKLIGKKCAENDGRSTFYWSGVLQLDDTTLPLIEMVLLQNI